MNIIGIGIITDEGTIEIKPADQSLLEAVTIGLEAKGIEFFAAPIAEVNDTTK